MSRLMIDETHDSSRMSWVESANGHSDFPVQNLPLGVFSLDDDAPRGGVAIGDWIIDLKQLAASGLLKGDAQIAATLASGPKLNPLLGAEPGVRRALRKALSDLLSDETHRTNIEPMLAQIANATMHLPAHIGDYTDFYVGIHHATNIGALFRPDNPLLPNYKHVPIGYHGRASSVRVSGEPCVRPFGQVKSPDSAAPELAPSRRLDYELELGIWVGQGNALGEAIEIASAANHIAGLTLLNDWSARDIQAWEYQPLGPFLAKNFLSTVSPWIVTVEALAPFRLPQPIRPDGDPHPLPYLWDEGDQASGALGLTLEVWIRTATMRETGDVPHRLSKGQANTMYWTIAQMLAHHTVNGCNLQPGDLLGSGTISGATQDSYGSLMELSKGGAQPITLPNGETRAFLVDGDEISLAAHAHAEGFVPIGFGPCSGMVQHARRR